MKLHNILNIFHCRDEIKDFFDRLKDPVEMKKLNIDPSKLSKSQILRTCIYLIEKKCDFNGEGIFLNSYANEFKDNEKRQMEQIIKKLKI